MQDKTHTCRCRLRQRIKSQVCKRSLSDRNDHSCQTWQVETVYSMIKRNQGSELGARSYWSQCREMLLKVLTHNFAIIQLVKELFYRAGLIITTVFSRRRRQK
jgi:hypothetical protein